jgi:hypothetical protein
LGSDADHSFPSSADVKNEQDLAQSVPNLGDPPPPAGTVGPSGGRVVCMRKILLLSEILRKIK